MSTTEPPCHLTGTHPADCPAYVAGIAALRGRLTTEFTRLSPPGRQVQPAVDKWLATFTAIQRRINQTQQPMDAIAATGGFVEIEPAAAPSTPAGSVSDLPIPLVHLGAEALEAVLDYDEERAGASLRLLTFSELTYLSVAAETLAGLARTVRQETWPAPGPRLQEIAQRAEQEGGRG